MKKNYLLTIFTLCLFKVSLSQPTPKDCSVELWATVQNSPPRITIKWLGNVGTTNYAVARKLKNSSTWTTLAASLPSTTTQYIDNTVAMGTHYEYRVVRTAVSGAVNYPGHGYINSGIEIPATENRGKLILLIANTFSATLSAEIKRLEADLEGDGWEVLKSFVSPTLAVTAVKAQIVNTYNLDPINTKALFLFGHIPVPYSGEFGPDAHPDHQGAWPADVYYGDMDGTWTDAVITSSVSNPTSPARTQNVPGDGKFDQSLLPSDVELQIGRVDLFGMPSFTATETQLLKNYLDKDHDYRKKNFTTLKRAVLDDNFGAFVTPIGTESFASSGFKNFGPLVTPTNVVIGDYFTTMTGNSYQWSYGTGPGTFNSAGGIGSTTDFTTSSLEGVFTMLFGSYFGDWDVTDNFLRAPLCQGKTLTNAWAGRPNWMFHHMAMGENIGYCARLTQNNTTTYFPSPFPVNYGVFNTVHIALMGDPTLRNDVIAPVANVVATTVGYNCNISWTPSSEPGILGYNIYMKNDTNKTYTKINSNIITGTTYTDNCMLYPGVYKYMVRALKLENTPSGTYYNLSEGIADTAKNNNYQIVKASFTNTLNLNTVTFTNNSSTNSIGYLWAFGNGTSTTSLNPPMVTYTANGSYTVILNVYNNCTSAAYSTVINITGVGLNEFTLPDNEFSIYPNPANTNITISDTKCESCAIVIYNNEGKQVYYQTRVSDKLNINVSNFKKGLYLIKFIDKENRSVSKKLVIE